MFWLTPDEIVFDLRKLPSSSFPNIEIRWHLLLSKDRFSAIFLTTPPGEIEISELFESFGIILHMGVANISIFDPPIATAYFFVSTIETNLY